MAHQLNLIFCDGACSGNPGPGGWGVVIRLVSGQIVELGGKALATTNNRMEITAVYEALKFIQDHAAHTRVFSDSKYVIQGVTEWVPGWQRRNWTTASGSAVLNQDLWESITEVWKSAKAQMRISLEYVPGHSGFAGNERVDEIATAYAKNESISLYRGPEAEYFVPLEIPNMGTAPKGTSKKKSGPAFSYLSLLGGVAERHQTWAECERRVKGRSNAKFKKSTSAADEAAILASWGAKLTK